MIRKTVVINAKAIEQEIFPNSFSLNIEINKINHNVIKIERREYTDHDPSLK